MTNECQTTDSDVELELLRHSEIRPLLLLAQPGQICCSLFRSFGVRHTGQIVTSILRFGSQA